MKRAPNLCSVTRHLPQGVRIPVSLHRDLRNGAVDLLQIQGGEVNFKSETITPWVNRRGVIEIQL
jgi:hypothetical protein